MYLEITHFPYSHELRYEEIGKESALSLIAGIAARLSFQENFEVQIEKGTHGTKVLIGMTTNETREKQIKSVLKKEGYIYQEMEAPQTVKVSNLLIRKVRFFRNLGKIFSLDSICSKDKAGLLSVFSELEVGTGIIFFFSKKEQLMPLTISNLSKYVDYPNVNQLLNCDDLYEGYIATYGNDSDFLAAEMAYELNMKVAAVQPLIASYEDLAARVKECRLPVASYLEELQYTFRLNEVGTMTEFQSSIEIPGGLPGNVDTLVTDAYQDMKVEDGLLIGNTQNGNALRVAWCDLKKHMWISGSPGSGKGNLLFSIATQLFHKDIPFLMFESAKSEQHHLGKEISDLKVWRALGGEMVINPFAIPEEITFGEYRSSLLQTLKSCFKLDGVLDEWFGIAMNNCYTKYGWTDKTTSNDYGAEAFGLQEFMMEFSRILEESTYEYRVKSDVMQAGIARLQVLFTNNHNIYDSVHSIPVTAFLDGHNVIQLNTIPTVVGKQQFATLLLIMLSAYMKLRFQHTDSEEIRLVIVLDEAHNLLQSVENHQGNEYSFAKDFVSLMLELRSLGVCFIVSNQSTQDIPKLIPDVCATKVFLGNSFSSGIQDYGMEMHLNEVTYRYLYKLQPGQGLLYSPNMPQAMCFQTPNVIERFDLKTPYPVKNSFIDENPYFCRVCFRECSFCPSRDNCTFESKEEAYRIASLITMKFGSKLEKVLQVEDTEKKIRLSNFLLVEMSIMLWQETKVDYEQNCALIQFARQYNRSHSVPVKVEVILNEGRERLKIIEREK